jgi:hypothetical protein
MEALPAGFWEEQQDMFFEVEVVGKVIGVDKVRPGDPAHNRHFRRREGPPDEVHSFDDRRFAVVARKCMKVCVCRVCRSVETGLSSVSEDGKGTIPHRSIYTPGSEEMAVARSWEKVRLEEKQKEAAYPDEAYRALLAIRDLCDGGPISLWDLSREMNVFNHRSLERPVRHIMAQCPEIGELDRNDLVIRATDPQAAPLIEELIARYEAFYEQQDSRPAPPQALSTEKEVLGRIKKTNNPTDNMQYYSKW